MSTIPKAPPARVAEETPVIAAGIDVGSGAVKAVVLVSENGR